MLMPEVCFISGILFGKIMKFEFENNELKTTESKIRLNDNTDFWRMFLDDGVYKEITVHSCKQKPSAIERTNGNINIKYDKILAEDGKYYDIDFTVCIKNNNGTYFSFELQNKSDIRVNEVMCPYLDIADMGCDIADEEYFYPNGLGERIKNPRARVANESHTEYVGADYYGITKTVTYPSFYMTMPWAGFQSGGKFLYIGSHDGKFRMTGFTIGTNARTDSTSRLLYAVSYYPAALQGEKLSYGDTVIKEFDGDWRCGSEFYREWSEKTWFKPKRSPEWVRRMTGWQRIIMKHQYGEIFFRYKDLPEIFKNGMKYGINTLLVFGWWKGCFDNHYPEYEVDPELGGEDELKNAIEQIHMLGGHVHLYTNGNLIDKCTDFYKNHGKECYATDIDGNPYEEHYGFFNEGTLLRQFGYKSFVTACSGGIGWKEHLLELGRMKLELGADAIFYDQLASNFRMCFCKEHLHGNRIDEDAAYKYKNMVAINELLSENKAFGSECVVDRLTDLVDYTHGCNFGNSYSPDAFPDMFRHTFPEYIMSNRFIHDEKKGFKKHLNYAFVTGQIFDVSVNRGRKCDISGYPLYGEYVKELIGKKEEYRDFFYSGMYESAYDISLPRNVFASNFISGEKKITAICNNTDEAVVIDVYGKPLLLQPDEYAVVEH